MNKHEERIAKACEKLSKAGTVAADQAAENIRAFGKAISKIPERPRTEAQILAGQVQHHLRAAIESAASSRDGGLSHMNKCVSEIQTHLYAASTQLGHLEARI